MVVPLLVRMVVLVVVVPLLVRMVVLVVVVPLLIRVVIHRCGLNGFDDVPKDCDGRWISRRILQEL